MLVCLTKSIALLLIFNFCVYVQYIFLRWKQSIWMDNFAKKKQQIFGIFNNGTYSYH